MQPFVTSVHNGIETHEKSAPASGGGLLSKMLGLQQIGEALARETDLQSLLDTVVRQSVEMTGAYYAALLLIIPGEQGLEVRAEWGGPEGPRPRCYLTRYGVARQALVSGKAVIRNSPSASDELDQMGLGGRSRICVPLIYKELVLGVLDVAGAVVIGQEAEENVGLLTTLASFAASAAYAVRLTRQQHHYTTALRDLQRHSMAVVAQGSEREILDDAAAVIARLLETEHVAIFLHDPDTVGLRLGGSNEDVSHTLEALADALHPGAIPAGYNNGLLFIPDVKNASQLLPTVREGVISDSISSLLSFAVGNERMAGLGLVLAAFDERPSLEAHQLELALLYANQVSVAIHTLRLSQQAAQTAREQAALFAITEALHTGGEAETVGQRVLDTLALAIRASGGCLLVGDLEDAGGGQSSLNGLQLVQTGTPHGQIEYYVAMVATGMSDQLPPTIDGEDWHALFARLETRFGLAGMLSLWRQPGAPRYTPREQELIATVSNELARHLENRALIARELAAISEASPENTASSQVSEMAARLAERAWTMAHAEGAAILIFDEDNDTYHIEAEFGELPDLRPAENPANIAYFNSLREPQMLFAGEYEQLAGPQPEDDEFAGQHLLLVPLRHDDLQVGVMIFAYGDAVKYRSRLPFIQAMVLRASVVLRNLRLQIDAEQLAMLEERNKIARTMHDGLAQQLAQIRFRTELVKRLVRDDPDRAMRELENVQQELKKGIGGIRRTINSLEPVMMKKLGLTLALKKLGEDLSEDSSNPVLMTVEGELAGRSLQAQLAVFRLAQEALSSVLNLHEEGECSCDVTLGDDEVEVRVGHNGEPRVDGVEDLLREQVGALVKSRGGTVDVENREGQLLLTTTMRL